MTNPSTVNFFKTRKNQKEKAPHTSNITTSTQPERKPGGERDAQAAAEKQQQMELVIMEQMVPEDHFLRKVDRAVDFSFIYDLCAPLYCADNGRPAIDPEILFRMLLVGYLYGIKSRRGWRKRSTTTSPTSVLRTGSDRQGAGRDDDQPEPSATLPGQQHRGTNLRRNSAAVCGEGTGRWSDPVYGFDAHQGQGEQAQEEAGGSRGHAEAYLSELTRR